VHVAQTLSESDFLLTVTGSTVVLMDIVFPDGSWVDALTMLDRYYPFVAPLIMADPVDAPFISEALNLGAFRILWRPVALDKLLNAIRLASEASDERAIWQRHQAR
jgi:DNA-binding NarL/FixJ family response regulator